jgi:hypothetical protein
MSTYGRRMSRPTSQVLRLGIAAIVMITGLVACSAGSGGAGGSSVTVGGATGTARAEVIVDWQHALQVIANLRAHPPNQPLVLMFGSSIVRESTTSDASWAAQVHARGGPSVAAYNLGSRNQSFAQDLKLVGYLPAVPTIVFIGVDVVRFDSPPSNPAVTLPAPRPVASSYDSHHYDGSRVFSASKKRALAADWMRTRYPVFRRYYSYNLRVLDKLIRECQARGLHPVLLDTPRNTVIVGNAFSKPVSRYRASSKKLAAKYGIPFVDMVAAASFANTDFFDLWHALPPGRHRWQARLSDETIKLLQRYGMK